MIDWNDAFHNGAYIEGATDYIARWTDAAAAFRDQHSNGALSQSLRLCPS
jgi:hypothetical protein